MRLTLMLDLLRAYAASEVELDVIHARLLPTLAADSLDVSASDEAPWVDDADGERLFWRLAYHLETVGEDDTALRRFAGRVVRCHDDTGPATTHELLSLLRDQDRLCTVVARHEEGVVSRTSFLSFVAECGYADHVKLWLRHAPLPALRRLCGQLDAGHYRAAALALESAPG